MTASVTIGSPPPEVARPLRELAALAVLRRWTVAGAVAQLLVVGALTVASGALSGKPVWMIREPLAVSPGPSPTNLALEVVSVGLLLDERGSPRLAAVIPLLSPSVAAWMRTRSESASMVLEGTGLSQVFIPESARETGRAESKGRRAVEVRGSLLLAREGADGRAASVSRLPYAAELVLEQGLDGRSRIVRWREFASDPASAALARLGPEVEK